MKVKSFTETRQNLKSLMDEVVRDHAPMVVTRQKAEAVVMVSLADWNALEETARLLASPRNAGRLTESIRQLDQGRGIERNLIES